MTLRCHHCGRATPMATRCPNCDSPRIRYLGGGTERLEREVRERFPALRVGRLDRDVVERRGAAERVVDAFSDGRLDVLVGTSLVTKGLDIPSVTLVGVVSSDVALNLPDERAAERTYQFLSQAVGRAGRGERPGRRDHPDLPARASRRSSRWRRGDAAAFLDAELDAAPAVRVAAVRAARQADDRAAGSGRRGARRAGDGRAPARPRDGAGERHVGRRTRTRVHRPPGATAGASTSSCAGRIRSRFSTAAVDAPWSVDVDPESLL